MKAIVTIMVVLGLLLGLQGCKDKQDEYEPAERDTWDFPVPEDEEEKIDLEDKPAEEAVPYEEEKEFDDPAESEEELEPDPDTEEPLEEEEEDLEEPGLDEPEVEDDKEL